MDDRPINLAHAGLQFTKDPKTAAQLEQFRLDVIEAANGCDAGARHLARIDDKKPCAVIQAFDTIDPEPIEWLWPGRIAIGKQSSYVGNPGTGKSQASLDLAARLSTGLPFPDGSRVSSIGDTLILTLEDDPADTIRPRLDALEADMSRIYFLHCKAVGEKKSLPDLTDLDAIQDAADQIRSQPGHRLRLLIVDPIAGFLGDADSHKDASVRAVLGPLSALASKERFAILGIQHLNKGGGSSAYRVGGSIAFTGVPRAVFIFARDPNDEERRVFLCLKNNLGPDHGGFEYSIVQAANGAPRISWLGPADDNLETILAQEKPKIDRPKIAPEQDRVLEYIQSLAPASVSSKAIGEALDKESTAVSNILGKLRDRGLIESMAYGHWRLTPPPPPKMNDESSESSETGKVVTSLSSLTSPAQVHDGSETGKPGAIPSPILEPEPERPTVDYDDDDAPSGAFGECPEFCEPSESPEPRNDLCNLEQVPEAMRLLEAAELRRQAKVLERKGPPPVSSLEDPPLDIF